MMLSQLCKILLIALLGTLAGCKVAAIVVQGGNITSLSQERNCAEGNICIFQVNTTSFSETYTAVPKAGWRFVKWNTGGDFICQGSTNPTCVVSNIGTAGNAGVEAIVASDATFYIMPVFEFVGNPITGTIFADGREWAQVSLFGNLTWNQINTVCPGGACNNGLAGYDMREWTWATVADVNSLFNSYIGAPILGPGPGQYIAFQFEFTNDVNADGWAGNNFPPDILAIIGFTRDAPPSSCSGIGIHPNFVQDIAATGGYPSLMTDCGARTSGGWFYRSPP